MKLMYEVTEKIEETNIVSKISIEELVFEWNINGKEDAERVR